MISTDELDRFIEQRQAEQVSELRGQLIAASQRVGQLEKLNSQLAAEVDRQRPVVDAAVEWRRWGYGHKADFCVGISPLLDAIDIYDVGAKRPCEEL